MQPDNSIIQPVPRNQRRRLIKALRNETVGGVLLLVSALIALVWANSGWQHSYFALTGFEVGPQQLGLHLSVSVWAADFLLAIFFFVVGVELKHEIVTGTLSNPRLAAVPMAAALGGMVTAGLIFLAFTHGTPAQSAWGIPISTDVAFALAVLAVVGRSLPIELRSFLLTLAVVNDLGAISVIAIVYSDDLHLKFFLVAIGLLAIFAVLQRKGVSSLYLYAPLAFVIWYMTFKSGIHATVAGVAMGLLMRVTTREGESESPGDLCEHRLRPITAGVCVPLFALVSAGVNIAGTTLSETLHSHLTQGIMLGLIVGQPIGVIIAALIAARFTRGSLNPSLSWWDVAVVGSLASIGFTVALLITQVTFEHDPASLATAKFAIVLTNGVAIIVASSVIGLRTLAIRAYGVTKT